MNVNTNLIQFSPWEDAIILLAIDSIRQGELLMDTRGIPKQEDRGICGILCIIRTWTTFIHTEKSTDLESIRLRSHRIRYGSLRGAFDLESAWTRHSDLQANYEAQIDAISALNSQVLPLKPQMEKEIPIIICHSQSDPLIGAKNEEFSLDKSYTGEGTLGRYKTRFFLPDFESDMKFIGINKAQVMRRDLKGRPKKESNEFEQKGPKNV
ncbi:uncharacterized protein EAF02_004604 [Botrytis sinoallii]|uniref:uncharacterized protein n=1 Tax=Botrytis sinoallii TaxID=1463999 RepID=UPI0019025F3F|nr:uncharacterized protein EAF02_004604 [Botrytis sinoallii]KAF7884268.1 hypothetical protein EAF02_004604 [Botrytis sinoallii]